jgi:transcriptional regulator with XRE-family HTH domain
VGEGLAERVGTGLRRARIERGLTLRAMSARSGGVFKPTAVAGYERAERSISLLRFCGLAELYGVPPEILLAQIIRADDQDQRVPTDLSAPGSEPISIPDVQPTE